MIQSLRGYLAKNQLKRSKYKSKREQSPLESFWYFNTSYVERASAGTDSHVPDGRPALTFGAVIHLLRNQATNRRAVVYEHGTC